MINNIAKHNTMKNSRVNIAHLSVWLQVETAIRNFEAYFLTLPYVDFACHVHAKFKLSPEAWQVLLERHESK